MGTVRWGDFAKCSCDIQWLLTLPVHPGKTRYTEISINKRLYMSIKKGLNWVVHKSHKNWLNIFHKENLRSTIFKPNGVWCHEQIVHFLPVDGVFVDNDTSLSKSPHFIFSQSVWYKIYSLGLAGLHSTVGM